MMMSQDEGEEPELHFKQCSVDDVMLFCSICTALLKDMSVQGLRRVVNICNAKHSPWGSRHELTFPKGATMEPVVLVCVCFGAMLVARLACLRALPVTGLRSALTQKIPALKPATPLIRPQQGFSSKARFGLRRSKTAKDQLQEAAFEPATETAIKIDQMGRIILAGGAAVGLGALCYYGLGMSNEIGALEKAVVGLTALSAVAVSRTPALLGLMMKGSWMAIGATFAAMIGAGMLVRTISYEHSPIPKHLAWMLHAGVMGAVVAPLTLLGGPLMLRAAWYTAGIMGGLSTVAMCAPSEKFLNMGGPLAAGFGVIFVSSLGSMFLPPTSAFGAGLYSVAVYGGLILFSMFLLYDTQKVIKRAETYPLYAVQKYDPINSEWMAVSRGMTKKLTRLEFATACTKIVTEVSSGVIWRLLKPLSKSFGMETILEASDKLKKMESESSKCSASGSKRILMEIKGAMMEAIRGTASGPRVSCAAEDPTTQLDDLSIAYTNEICDKILALRNVNTRNVAKVLQRGP
ncbi:hypothetical protein QTP86_005030 [Hemibagrus guttatus]|nr:hypothetical protein QTP86_005030 [Hemibagrus guttatus]